MEEKKELTYDDLQKELAEFVNKSSEEYNKNFHTAYLRTAESVANKYLAEHPKATKEEVSAEVKKYLELEPSELERTMRIYCNSNAMIFNLFNRLATELTDFKELYIAINSQKLESIANKQAKIIKQQQEAEEVKKGEETKAIEEKPN